MVEEARSHPGGWVYEIEGGFRPEDPVPPTAIRGAWKVSEKGELTGEFERNPGFVSANQPSKGASS
jgi:hypothetical protein